jgi:fluoride exporter
MTPLVLAATVFAGALGATLRWLITRALPHTPWWSLGVVNTVGSAIVGIIAALPESFWTYPLMVGLAGGLTTFSTLAIMMVPQRASIRVGPLLAALALHLALGIASCAGAFLVTTALV